MAARSELAHRTRELRAALLGRLATRSFSRRTTGVDGVVKKLLAKQAGQASDLDPDLLHDDPDFQVPAP